MEREPKDSGSTLNWNRDIKISFYGFLKNWNLRKPQMEKLKFEPQSLFEIGTVDGSEIRDPLTSWGW